MNLNKTIIGMVHVAALPGTPENKLQIDEIVEMALAEVLILKEEGIPSILIENMHDRPYLNKNVGPEIVAAMTGIACRIKSEVNIPVGIQILAGANREALAVALAAQLDFIRAEGFVFGHLADEGWINSDAGDLLRYRKQIGAGHIKIFTDIKKKHSSHAATSDISLEETAKAAEFFLSDGLIITGKSTGKEVSVVDVKVVKEVTELPVLIGSGINPQNLHEYWDFADAFIVGSSVKINGHWENPIDRERVKKLMETAFHLKK